MVMIFIVVSVRWKSWGSSRTVGRRNTKLVCGSWLFIPWRTQWLSRTVWTCCSTFLNSTPNRSSSPVRLLATVITLINLILVFMSPLFVVISPYFLSSSCYLYFPYYLTSPYLYPFYLIIPYLYPFCSLNQPKMSLIPSISD